MITAIEPKGITLDSVPAAGEYQPKLLKELQPEAYVVKPGWFGFVNSVEYLGEEESIYSKLQKDVQLVNGKPIRGTINEFTHNFITAGKLVWDISLREQRQVFESKELQTLSPFTNIYLSKNSEFWIIKWKDVPDELAEEAAYQTYNKYNGQLYDFGEVLYFGLEALAEKFGLDVRRTEWFLSNSLICSALMAITIREGAKLMTKWLPRHPQREPYFRLIERINQWDVNNIAPPDNAIIMREFWGLFELRYERLLTTSRRF